MFSSVRESEETSRIGSVVEEVEKATAVPIRRKRKSSVKSRAAVQKARHPVTPGAKRHRAEPGKETFAPWSLTQVIQAGNAGVESRPPCGQAAPPGSVDGPCHQPSQFVLGLARDVHQYQRERRAFGNGRWRHGPPTAIQLVL